VPTIENRVNTTVNVFLPDGAIPGFASIIPTNLAVVIQNGVILLLNGADEVIVEEICPSTLVAGLATIEKYLMMLELPVYVQ